MKNKWLSLKYHTRIWIERTNRDSSASFLVKALALVVWKLHWLRSALRNYPRLFRIWIRFSEYDKSASRLRKFVISIPLLIIKLTDRSSLHEWSDPPCADGSLDDKLNCLIGDSTEDFATSQEREHLANNLARETNRHILPEHSANLQSDNLEELKRNGILALPSLTLNQERVNRIREYFESKPVYAAHVPEFSDQIPRRLSDPQSRAFPFGSYAMKDTVYAPELLNLAFDPKVLALAESYLGCAPSLFSVHAWWSFPGHHNVGPQLFHRDIDDFRFLALFVYLTDVEGGAEGGEHEFICHTQRQDSVANLFQQDQSFASEFFPPKALGCVVDETKMFQSVFKENIRSITGKAGSVFIADTYALHRGVRPTSKPRLVCWIRYGYRANLAYRSNHTKPIDYNWRDFGISETPYNRFVGRHLLK